MGGGNSRAWRLLGKKETSGVAARFLVGKTWVGRISRIREECWDNHEDIQEPVSGVDSPLGRKVEAGYRD